MDDAIGAILAELEEMDRLASTMIVVLSDNGFLWGEHRWKGKNIMYEESIRVPFVVRYDPLISAGSMSEHLVLNIDLAPTFAHLAGVDAPEVEGQSFLPLVVDDTGGWRTDLLVEHLKVKRMAAPTYCTVRNEEFTYAVLRDR